MFLFGIYDPCDFGYAMSCCYLPLTPLGQSRYEGAEYDHMVSASLSAPAVYAIAGVGWGGAPRKPL